MCKYDGRLITGVECWNEGGRCPASQASTPLVTVDACAVARRPGHSTRATRWRNACLHAAPWRARPPVLQPSGSPCPAASMAKLWRQKCREASCNAARRPPRCAATGRPPPPPAPPPPLSPLLARAHRRTPPACLHTQALFQDPEQQGVRLRVAAAQRQLLDETLDRAAFEQRAQQGAGADAPSVAPAAPPPERRQQSALARKYSALKPFVIIRRGQGLQPAGCGARMPHRAPAACCRAVLARVRCVR